ncbi:uncharacterized protein LOC126850908 isoform X2 [Cataglyphis hispanica]|uniref:uncharacterized protein LOC126850908 isoform X2 n=1 Tax=Cataglyphis hispanica TaxID=1086592 RepID=UPI00217F4051|nr:uncharacterized protein LOC126850908 isoform X2 [Cataglyphis hispanica]
MSVLRFAEDFSRLVMSYMKENLNLKKSKPNNVIVPLTNEQIAYTVHHVLRALGIKDSENDNDNEFETKDLNQGSDISKPIPIISKINDTENNENTYRSENRSHLAVTDSGLSFSDTSLKTNEKEAENSLNILQNEKKEDVFENSFCSSLNDIFIQSLEEIRESAVNITLKIDDLKKQASKQTQQSYPNSLLNFNRTSTITKKGPTKIRRSLTTFSGTSVSSKTHVVEKEDTLPDRRKSTGGACSITPKKLSTKLDSSVSKLDGLYNKMSPSLIPKNPKYAHVKSTIPKPTFITKKKP